MTFKRQGTQPGGLFDEQPSVRHVYSHAIPALYARSVKQLTVQDSTVRYADKSEAWASEVTTLEDCTESAVDLKKFNNPCKEADIYVPGCTKPLQHPANPPLRKQRPAAARCFAGAVA